MPSPAPAPGRPMIGTSRWGYSRRPRSRQPPLRVNRADGSGRPLTWAARGSSQHPRCAIGCSGA
eukprot:14899103-Alexandrium_andersonii.AAC.1